MPSETKRVDLPEIYKSFRGYENAIRYLADIIGAVLLSVPNDGETRTTVSIDKDTADNLLKIRIGQNHPCETPPYCRTTVEALAREVGTWTSRAPALHEAAVALARAIEGLEIPFIPSVLPGSDLPPGRHGHG